MVIKILGDFVNNKIIDKDFFNENIIDVANEENSQKIYIGRIYYIAKKHNLVSIMAQAMEKLGFESDSDIWKRWLKEKNQLIYKSVLMDVDAFNLTANWYDNQCIAIDQGPIICMIENYRTGMLWNLFMAIPEIQQGMKKLGFESPALN